MLSDEPFGAPEPVERAFPARGEVWPDSRLAAALGAGVGTELSIGAGTFRVSRILITRPDQGATFLELAPSLIMNEADLASTQLDPARQPAARARSCSRAPRAEIASFKTWLEANKKPNEEIEDVEDSAPQIKSAIDRSARFLSIASLVAVLLCAIAVAMAARRYVHRHLDSVALLKTLGATRALHADGEPHAAHAGRAGRRGARFAAGLRRAGLAGQGARGAAARRSAAARSRAARHRVSHRDRGARRLRAAAAAAAVAHAGAARPAPRRRAAAAAGRSSRSARRCSPSPSSSTGCCATSATALAFVGRPRRRSSLVVGAGAAGCSSSSRPASAAASASPGATASRTSGRRRTESVVQLTAFALGIMMLLLLAVVRNDLLNDWRRSLPADTPNFFFINIPPDEHQAFTTFLEERGAQHARARPMVRARMTQINGKPIDDIKFATRARPRVRQPRSEHHLGGSSSAATTRSRPASWFTPEDFGKPLVSVSTEYMEEMNLKLGDELQFDIAGETRSREDLERARSEVGQLSAELLPDVRAGPARGLAGHVDDGRAPASHQSEDHRATWCAASRASRCSTSMICCARCARSSTRRVAAVQSVFLFTLMAGLVVLIAAVQASREERRYESAMLRTLGAQRSHGAQGPAGGVRGARRAVGHARGGRRVDRRRIHRDAGAADSLHAGSAGCGSTASSAAACWSASPAGSPRARSSTSRRC